MLFQDLSKGMVQQGLAQARREAEEKKRRERDELEEYYAGGSDIASKLRMHPAEDTGEFADRQARLIYPNYVARLADSLIDGVYGDPVNRTIQDATEQQEEILQDIWDWNVMLRTQREIAYGVVVLGDAWANVAWLESAQQLAVNAIDPRLISYTTDPDNPNLVVEAVESRAVESVVHGTKPRMTHWVWTLDEYGHFDDDGNPVDDGTDWPQPNPYGIIPYIHWRGRSMIGTTDGLSYIRDSITIQRALLNRLSDEDVLCIEQIHGLLVLKEFQQPSGQHGPKRALTVGPDGDAFFINPNAAIKDLEESIDRLVRMLFETGSVPMSLVSGGTASSGLQLAIEMRPFTRIVESIRSECVASEKQLIEAVCIVGSKHGLGLPEDVQSQVEFSDNVLPSDRDAEFNRDLLMLQNGLMTRADFLRRWIDKLGDDEGAIREYEELLDAENSRGAQKYGGDSLSGLLGIGSSGGGTTAPPSGGGSDPGGGIGIEGDKNPGYTPVGG